MKHLFKAIIYILNKTLDLLRWVEENISPWLRQMELRVAVLNFMFHKGRYYRYSGTGHNRPRDIMHENYVYFGRIVEDIGRHEEDDYSRFPKAHMKVYGERFSFIANTSESPPDWCRSSDEAIYTECGFIVSADDDGEDDTEISKAEFEAAKERWIKTQTVTEFCVKRDALKAAKEKV